MGVTELVFELLVRKAGINGFLASYTVAMVTIYGMKMIKPFTDDWAFVSYHFCTNKLPRVLITTNQSVL